MSSEWLGWLIAAYLAGALALVMADAGRWKKDELAALASWPLTVPFFWTLTKIQRWWRTCNVCGNRYHDRAAMQRHAAREHTPVAAIRSGGDENK